MKIVFYCLAQDKAGLAMAMERNVLSLITKSLFDEQRIDIILGSSNADKSASRRRIK